ncbi:MAG TPA: shikimate dehydrogenase [Bacteroidetes bacterium]|nr:shikimate dehydrogenase [Bacteroidota bacterium]
MKTYGLIGNPLTHSFSAAYFREKFRKEKISGVCYRNFPLADIHDFPHLLAAVTDLAGLNVTIPYKESVIPFLDELDSEAEAVGAVNVVCFLPDRRTRGYNTDVTGFRKALEPYLKPVHRKALILGTGGASRAAARVLEQLNIPFLFVSRTPVNERETAYGDLNEQIIRSHRLIVQTTPLGMTPDTDRCPPIPYRALGKDHLLFDLIYNPLVTRFMQKGEEQGAVVVNGLEMLKIQVQEPWKLWIRVSSSAR